MTKIGSNERAGAGQQDATALSGCLMRFITGQTCSRQSRRCPGVCGLEQELSKTERTKEETKEERDETERQDIERGRSEAGSRHRSATQTAQYEGKKQGKTGAGTADCY